MTFPRQPTRSPAAPLWAIALATAWMGCGSPASPLAETSPNVSGLADGGVECPYPGEGCICEPGADAIECVLPPVTSGGRTVCQHGTRSCREGVWSACENITTFFPSSNKILGAPASTSSCTPDEYLQVSTPDLADITPANSTNLTYTTLAPPGLILDSSLVPTDPNLGLGPDTDGDGVGDLVDACPTQIGWTLPCDGSALDDGFYHVLQPGQSAIDPMPIELTVKSADIYVLVDTTTSMQAEIDNIRSSLTTGTLTPGCSGGLLGAIQCSIPGSAFGIGMTRDYPVNRDSNTNDFPYIHLLDPTTSTSLASGIVGSLMTEGNYHWPEATGQALYSMASGRGLGSFLPNRTCPNGGTGWACFRPGSVPVAIVLTDAPFWSGASYASGRNTLLTYNSYSFGGFATAGRDNMSGVALPVASVTSPTGQTVLSNDTSATAYDFGDITGQSVSAIGSTAGSMTSAHSSSCSGVSAAGPDAYYRFTLTATRSITLESYGDFDTQLHLYEGATRLNCDNDSGAVLDAESRTVWDDGARITRNLNAGTYTVVVDSSASSREGTFQLRITNGSAAPTATTAATEVSWASTVAALNAAGVKTIGVASCEGGCTDLDARQGVYAACINANDTASSTHYCGRAYARCNARGWSTPAVCTAIYDSCLAGEISAGRQCSNVQDRACGDAERSCRDNWITCPRIWTVNGCWSWWRGSYDCYRDDPSCQSYGFSRDGECRDVRTSCEAASDTCTTAANDVCTCVNSSSSSTSDASLAYCDETLYDLGQLGVQTGSVRSDGTPFVYRIADNGSGLSGTIAEAVRELAQYILFDVTASCDDPLGTGACTTLYAGAAIGTPSPVTGTAPGCDSCVGASCYQCTPGAGLPYEVTFQNAATGGVAPTSVPQVFDFFVVLRDANGQEMSRVPVRIVVPPIQVQYPPSGHFQQLYDGNYDPLNMTGCPYPGRRADWGTFTYTVNVPAGTRIVFSFRTADTEGDLSSATPVSVTVTASATGATVDVGEALVAAGLANYMPFLQVTASLYADPTLTLTPTLQSYTQQYTCVDAE